MSSFMRLFKNIYDRWINCEPDLLVNHQINNGYLQSILKRKWSKVLHFSEPNIINFPNFNTNFVDLLLSNQIKMINNEGIDVTYNPLYKVFLETNIIPGCNGNEELASKLRILPFNATFTNNPIKNNEKLLTISV